MYTIDFLVNSAVVSWTVAEFSGLSEFIFFVKSDIHNLFNMVSLKEYSCTLYNSSVERNSMHFHNLLTSADVPLLLKEMTLNRTYELRGLLSYNTFFTHQMSTTFEYCNTRKCVNQASLLHEVMLMNCKPVKLTLRDILMAPYLTYLRRHEMYSNISLNCDECRFLPDVGVLRTHYIKDLLKSTTSPVVFDLPSSLWFINSVTNRLMFVQVEYALVLVNFICTYTSLLLVFVLCYSNIIKFVRRVNWITYSVAQFKVKSDQEPSSIEDITMFFIFLCVCVLNSLNFCNSSGLLFFNINITFWIMSILAYSSAVLLPISIVWYAGSGILSYVRGYNKNNIFTSYLLFDFMSSCSFLVRFNLQVMRWSLIIVSYYLLHEFTFEWFINQVIYTTQTLNNITETANANTAFHSATILAYTFVRTVFELFDLIVLVTIQISAFVSVLLWLFNALFSISVNDVYEAPTNKNYEYSDKNN